MIVASVNPQPQQQTRPGNEMFGEMVPHHQNSGLLNEPSMLKVHPLTHQPPGPVDISVVPYEGFVQHPYSQSSGQPPLHHPSNQLHDAVVISSGQHPSQSHGTVMPTYIQQQPIAHPAQVQSQESLLIGHYPQSAHPHHDIVLPTPNQQYPAHPPGAVVFASHQNAYHQPPEMLPTQQQFVAQPQAAHFPGVLVSPTHHAPYGPHDGVVHSHQPPYPMHDAGLLHPSVMVNPHMPSAGLPCPPPVPAAAPHQYPGQLHGSVVPAYHSQYPGSIQGTVVPGPPPPHHNGMLPAPPPSPPQHTNHLHGTVVPPPQHPNPLPGGVITPLHQHQNLGSLHNGIMPSGSHQYPGSLQGTIVSHQHTSPIHSAAVMPNHHHHQQQQQHPAAIFGNLTSHQQHPGSLHPSVLPCPRQHPTSSRLHSSVGPSPSRQQHQLNGGVPPLPLQQQHHSSSKSNDNYSVGLRQLQSSSTTSSTPLKAHDDTGHSAATTTTTTSTAGSHQNPKVIDSDNTTTSSATTIQNKFYSTATISSSVCSDPNGQSLSQHVPIKKLGTLASKPNAFSDSRNGQNVGQSSYKDVSTANDSTSGPAPNKTTTSANSNHGPWESRTSYSTTSNSIKSASVSPSLSTTSIESSSENYAPACSQRSLPSQASLIPPRMSLSVNGMLPPTNSMVGKMFGYQHTNGTISSSSVSGRSVSPLLPKKDQASPPTSNSEIDAITTGLEKSRLHDNQYGRQLENTNGNNRRRYISESWRRQNSESAAASYSFSKQQQPLWSSSQKDQIKVVNLPVEQMKRPMYPLKMSKNSYSSAESSKHQPRDTLHLTFFLH